jgi:hypothetical protein
MARLPWGHESRHCERCGKVGPRIWLRGWVHLYCLTNEERAERRKAQRSGRTA